MKFHHLFLMLLFFLASCTTSTPTPTATPVPTSTLTPIPTVTQSASPTPEAWVAVSEEYGMPVEMARQLEGMDVSFDKDVSPYVDGMLVVNNVTGEHLYYFDAEQTEIWVDVDRFEGTTDIENIKFTITEEELRSAEMTAWLYYKASKLEFDLEKINNVGMKYISANGVEWIGYEGKNNFGVDGSAPFERNPGALMYIDTSDVDKGIATVFTPAIYLDPLTMKLQLVRGFLRGSSEDNHVFVGWQDEMRVSLIISNKSDDMSAYNSPIETNIPHSKFDEFKEGNFAALSSPEVVVEMLSAPGPSNN